MADIFEIAEGFRAALLKNERAAAVRLVKAYGAAWNRISADLAKLNKQIDAARSRGEVVDQWWLIRQERYRSLLDQITREMSRFADFAESQITAEQRRAIAAARNDAQRLMIAAVGEAPEAIAPNFNRLPASAVENLAGFLSNGSPLNRLLGEFAPSARQQIEQGLMSAIAQGWGARKTATAIRKALGGNLVRALRIARTETIRAYRETTHRTFQANADVMDGWYWLSARNARTCPTCWALHGTFHPITERLAGHVSCRCTQMPRTKSLAELGFPGAPDTRPAVKRGEDLFADQPADVQQQVLGAAFAAYRDGRIKLTDLVGRKESPQWGASYYTLGVGRALNNEGRFPGYSEPPKPAPSVLQSITPRRALSPAQIALIRTAPAYRDPDGIPDTDKIAVESLGLMHANPFPPKLKNRAQKAGVALDQITLGRPALDRERLLRAAEALAQEIKAEGKGIEPIRLAQRPDGSFVVSGDGNHRIAALKLLGYEGEIPALVRYQKAAPIAAGRKAKAAGEGVASTGGSADAQAARAQMKQIQRENKKQVKEIYAAFDQAVKDEAAAIARGDFAEAVRLGLNRPRLLAEAERVRNGLKEQQRAALYQETESEFKIAQPYARFIEWDKGVSAFRRLIGKGWLDGEEVRFWAIGDRERAYYEKGEVNVQTKASAGIVVHELGHWLEDSSPKIFNEVTKFLQRRTKGEKAVPLKQFNKRYDADEETRPDKFLDPYMGKVYETNGKRKASEVVSMGLELFYNDPAKLAEKDPDFFDFIYDLVRNRP